MTRQRIYGEDKPFLAWIRAQEQLPSISVDFGVTVNDADIFVHRFKSPVTDEMGTREVQAIMHIETKTRGGLPSASQIHSLSAIHAFSGVKRAFGSVIWNFGAFVLVMSGESPDTSEWMQWYALPEITEKQGPIGDLRYAKRFDIDAGLLLRILRFDLNPKTLAPQPFRRHHKTREILRQVKMPLGFVVDERVVMRS